MYAARIARPDFLRTISFVARYLTKWDQMSQKRLHRLMSYINNTTRYRMHAWNTRSDDLMEVHLKVYSDSDYVGCPVTQRSTIGSMVCLAGDGFIMSVGFMSNRQGCVSRSTPEAELVAMDMTIRMLVLPLLSLMDDVFRQSTNMDMW